MRKPLLPMLLGCALALPGLAMATDTATAPHRAKPSSFAPHHGGKHVYGAPIQQPILHKRHKTSRRTPKGDGAAGQPRRSGAR
jgi:hypothetical protein